MKGATALDCENTSSRPNSTNTTTMGTSQYFFSCLRNCQNSPMTRPLLIRTPSEHSGEVMRVFVARRMRRPSAPGRPASRERVPADQPPHDSDRRQNEQKKNRQQHACVEPAQNRRELPPDVA